MNITVCTCGLFFLELASVQAFHRIVKETSAVSTERFFMSMLIPEIEPDHRIYRFLFPLYPSAFFTHIHWELLKDILCLNKGEKEGADLFPWYREIHRYFYLCLLK